MRPEVYAMWQKLPGIVLVAMLSGSILFAQGTDTKALPTDWEEINFEFNQAVVVDGFPGLLRLAGLLKEHPDYKVTLTGHADQIGSNRYNQALSQRRANAVSQFLQHYGAAANQIQVKAEGKRTPEVSGRDRNQRFINRRVTVTVTAPDGTQVGDGSLTAAIMEFQRYAREQLGKIDNVVTQLGDVQNGVKAIQSDTGAIKQSTSAIQQSTTAIQQDTGAIRTDTQELVKRPPPLTAEQTTQIARTEATRAADYALTQSALRNRKYSLIGFDVGPTFANGSVHSTGKTGNYSADVYAHGLIPFGNGRTPDQPGTHGLQLDGNWMYFHKNGSKLDGRSDGMFDLGLVNRFRRVQLGAFAQFDYVSLNAYRGGAFLGNGVLTVDFVMPKAIVGIFGTKGFRDNANISTTPGTAAVFPAYLRLADQVGLHAATALGDHFEVELSAAYVKRLLRGADTIPAASLKFSYVPHENVAFFIAADEDPTFQNIRFGSRAVFGIEFGSWLRPKNYGTTEGVIPVSVPRPHYEILGR